MRIFIRTLFLCEEGGVFGPGHSAGPDLSFFLTLENLRSGRWAVVFLATGQSDDVDDFGEQMTELVGLETDFFLDAQCVN